jgi:glycosyltransferase 2 family protein
MALHRVCRVIKKILKNWQLLLGLALSLLFLYLAFRHVDFRQMATAFAAANYWYLIPALFVLIISLWLRSWRWQYLLAPIHSAPVSPLFKSLLIGYLFNIFLPAHLGEIVRAYMLARKQPISASAAFGTIVLERIIDVLTMLLLLAVAMIVYPFPQWVKTGGYLTCGFILILFVLLVLFKKYQTTLLPRLQQWLRPLSNGLAEKIDRLLRSFLQGFVPLKKRSHYAIVFIQSICLWSCYGYIFQLVLHAFNFISTYALPWTASLVLLVITTFGILVPSSPGYVGTYHYLCQLSLALFGVPASPALTFAFVMHGLNFIPVLVLGFFILSREGLSISGLQKSTRENKT